MFVFSERDLAPFMYRCPRHPAKDRRSVAHGARMLIEGIHHAACYSSRVLPPLRCRCCCTAFRNRVERKGLGSSMERTEKHREAARAPCCREYLLEDPRTITSAPAPRSAGGLQDFYSEGDYCWPNPANPIGPYIRRDGESNPDNFVAHRELLLRFSIQIPALTAAWLLTRNRTYAEHAVAHMRAWFIAPATSMNPNLEYAQAIHGVDTGRSIGIIDTVHLVEVAQSVLILQQTGGISAADNDGVHSWFSRYLDWLTNSDRGHQERNQ